MDQMKSEGGGRVLKTVSRGWGNVYQRPALFSVILKYVRKYALVVTQSYKIYTFANSIFEHM